MSSTERPEKEGSGSADEVVLSGPPEPVLSDDGTRDLLIPTDDDRPNQLSVIRVGTWVCQRCDTEITLGLDRNHELQEPHECSGCEREGPFKHKGELADEEIEAAVQAGREWVPITGISDYHVDDRSQLWDDVREYISTYWKAGNDAYYDLLTAWAMSTWFRPNLRASTHLMTLGKTKAGKTRLLNTLSRVCYRARVTASATPSSMFRHIDAYNMTYFVSEYHGLGADLQRELDNVIRAGQKRDEYVTRSEQSASGGYRPKSFNPFTHAAVASQYVPDDDIQNRCIQVQAKSADGHVPSLPREKFDTESETIREQLLYERFRLIDSDEWQDAFDEAREYCDTHGIYNRTREKVMSLLSVAIIFDRKDSFKNVVDLLVADDRDAEADSEDALVVRAVQTLALEQIEEGGPVLGADDDVWADVQIPVKDITRQYNNMTGEDRKSSWVGQVLSRLDFNRIHTRDGRVVSDENLKATLEGYCDEYGINLYDALEHHSLIREMPADDVYTGKCSECGENRVTIRFKHVDGFHLCEACGTSFSEVRGD
jgi:hypothetical protein